MESVWVPGGCFDMDCGAWTQDWELYEYPVHRVCADGFWLGRFEVIQDQWQRVMDNNPAENRGDSALPVEMMSWYEAKAFAERLSSLGAGVFRLPTEAQWEFAARSGGKSESFAGGAQENATGWNYENFGGRSHLARGKVGNGLGLSDMTGNVFEWCEACSTSLRTVIWARTTRARAGTPGAGCRRGGSFR